MLDQARKAGQVLPMAALNEAILSACVEAGEGDLDNSVVLREISRRQVPASG
jgi:3-hydroxyisobutyrate dehydrogenase-like beta-hydroxyacid dehydrogenase